MNTDNLNSLYMNTQFKILESQDRYLESETNLAMREISALIGNANDINTCYIKTLSQFCLKTNIDCKTLYIASRKSNRNEVTYRFKHMELDNIEFSVIIERYDDEMKAGIIIDFEK